MAAGLPLWLQDMLVKEGWKPHLNKEGKWVVEVEGLELPAEHPATIHLKLYKDATNPDLKFIHMKGAHDYLWPREVASWHRWTEKRFRTHCEGYSIIPWAGPASSAKSYDAAKIGLLFWMANVHGRMTIVMSTTLESLNSRIYGYCLDLLATMELDFPAKSYQSNPPRIGYLYADRHVDYKHCVKALAAKRGDTSATIQNLIGRHPKEGLLVILDEGPDMPVSLLEAIPNWEQTPLFQLMCMGNSSSRYDLHGALSTPLLGWEKIDPMKDFEWDTVRVGGKCLYFNPYDSPAISETDPAKKEILGRFLPTEEKLAAAAAAWGDSEQYWRMGLGIWKSEKTEDVAITKAFIDEFRVETSVRWAPSQQMVIVGGLDVAFSSGGDKCILRLGVLGWDEWGNRVLDFQGEKLLFPIDIKPSIVDSAEAQIATQVLQILNHFGVRLSNVACDANGGGRAMSGYIKLAAQGNDKYRHLAEGHEQMIKIYSVRKGNMATEASWDVTIKNAYDLWADVRDFIQHDQLKGIDSVTYAQLTSRKVQVKGKVMVLEDKKEYKARMKHVNPSLAHSPDEADAGALCLQAAIIRHGFRTGQRRKLQAEGLGVLEAQKLQAAVLEGQFKKISDRERVVDSLKLGEVYSGDIYGLGGGGCFRKGY